MGIFKAICGPENAGRTVLLTTGWDRLERSEEGEERVRVLKEEQEFWGDFYEKGGFVERIGVEEQRRDALRVVSLLLGGDGKEGELRAQRQIIREKMMLYQTDAGKIAYGGLVSEKEKLEQEMLEQARDEIEEQLEQSRAGQLFRIVEMSGAAQARLDTRLMEMEKGSGELEKMWDLKMRNDLKKLKLELERNQELLGELAKTLEDGSARGKYKDKERRREMEKEVEKVRKKIEVLQKAEGNGLGAFDALLTGGRVVGGGLGIAAAVVPLATCCVM